MAAPARSVVFRVTWLALDRADAVVSSLTTVINKHLSLSESAHLKYTVSAIPSCDDEHTSAALVTFQNGVPLFLNHLVAHPLADYPIETDDGDINFDRHFFGLTQLYYSDPAHPVDADIIAITGLDGHAYGSWRGKGELGRMWLRDFLSKDLPRCRTMTYGYNSKLLSQGIDTIMTYGLEFIEGLERVRNTPELRQRPVIFIAHSFGGIILAHTVVKAKQADGEDRPAIASLYKATYGILFFATPHKGLIIDDIQSMIAAAENHPRNKLLQEIKLNSDLLASQLIDFKNLIRDRKIVSFFETEQTRRLEWDPKSQTWGRTGNYITVADMDTSILQLPIQTESPIPLHSDHSQIVKFDSRNVLGYKFALEKLREFVADAPNVVSRRFHLVDKPQRSPFPRYNPVNEISTFFVQRVDLLQKIVDSLQTAHQHASGNQPRTVIIQGLPGSGKSQLVRQFAKSWYDDQRPFYWMDASSVNTLNRSFLRFAMDANLGGNNKMLDGDPEYVRQKVCDYIADHAIDWLLVYDNYDILEMKDGEYYNIRKFFPLSSRGRIIVTTRNREVVDEVTGILIEIGAMSGEEAVALFQKHGGLLEGPRPMDQLKIEMEIACNLLGSFPLAIAQGAAFFKQCIRPDVSAVTRLESYRKRYIDHEHDMLKSITRSRVSEDNRSVIATFDMSFEVIVHNNRAAAELLLLFGFFHHSNIQGEIFERAFNQSEALKRDDHIDTKKSSYEWLDGMLTPTGHDGWDRDFAFEPAMRLLENYSLVSRPQRDSWSIHPLVHAWTLLGRQYPSLSSLNERAHLALAVLGRLLNERLEGRSHEAMLNKMRFANHLESCLKVVRRYTKVLETSYEPRIPAGTLLRARGMSVGPSQSVESKNSKVEARLELLALINGCKLDGLDKITSLNALSSATLTVAVNMASQVSLEEITQLAGISSILLQLLPKAAARDQDPDFSFLQYRLSYWLAQFCLQSQIGQYDKAIPDLLQLYEYAKEYEAVADDNYQLRVKNAALTGLFSCNLRLEPYLDRLNTLSPLLDKLIAECEILTGDGSFVTVSSKILKALVLYRLGRVEEAEELATSQIRICDNTPELLEDVKLDAWNIVRLYSLRTGDAAKLLQTHRASLELEAKMNGPFHQGSLLHKRRILQFGFDLQQDRGMRNIPDAFGLIYWDKRDDNLSVPIELAICYKANCQNEEIGPLWNGIIDQAKIEELPGTDLKDFAYAFNIAAEVAREQGYKDAATILEDNAKRLAMRSNEIMRWKRGEMRSVQLFRISMFWNLLEKAEAISVVGPDSLQQRRELGTEIRKKLQDAPAHAKASLLFLCVQYLELLFCSERYTTSLPIDPMSLSVISLMTTNCFGPSHRLAYRMKSLLAITSRLLINPPEIAVLAEEPILQHTIKHITDDSSTEDGFATFAGSVTLERLHIEYRRRKWYHASIRLYEATTAAFIPKLGLEQARTIHETRQLFELYARTQEHKKFKDLLNIISQHFENAFPSRRGDIVEAMRLSGSTLHAMGFYEMALDIHEWTWERGQVIAAADRNIPWQWRMMKWMKETNEALGNEEAAKRYAEEEEKFAKLLPESSK